MSKDIWVLAEHTAGDWHEVALELLGEARRLAGTWAGNVIALVLSGKNPDVTCLGEYGADEVYLLEHPLLQSYNTELYTNVLSRLVAERQPELILMGATVQGKDLAPRLATRLHTGFVPDCVSLGVNSQGHLELTRAIYEGNVYSTWACLEKRPVIATVRPGVLGKEQPVRFRPSTVTRIPVELDAGQSRTKVVDFIPADPSTIDIAEADVLLVLGRGLGDKDKLVGFKELASLLGAAIGGSRPTVDNTWLPKERQIGLTGKTVAAKLMIVCGVSGSTQFMTGMKGCQFIIAVNTDRAAPIFKIADISIRCDMHQLRACLVSSLNEAAATGGRV